MKKFENSMEILKKTLLTLNKGFLNDEFQLCCLSSRKTTSFEVVKVRINCSNDEQLILFKRHLEFYVRCQFRSFNEEDNSIVMDVYFSRGERVD